MLESLVNTPMNRLDIMNRQKGGCKANGCICFLSMRRAIFITLKTQPFTRDSSERMSLCMCIMGRYLGPETMRRFHVQIMN